MGPGEGAAKKGSVSPPPAPLCIGGPRAYCPDYGRQSGRADAVEAENKSEVQLLLRQLRIYCPVVGRRGMVSGKKVRMKERPVPVSLKEA